MEDEDKKSEEKESLEPMDMEEEVSDGKTLVLDSSLDKADMDEENTEEEVSEKEVLGHEGLETFNLPSFMLDGSPLPLTVASVQQLRHEQFTIKQLAAYFNKSERWMKRFCCNNSISRCTEISDEDLLEEVQSSQNES